MASLPKKKPAPPSKAKMPKDRRPAGKKKVLVGRPDLVYKDKSNK
jgi:hypothetical protein